MIHSNSTQLKIMTNMTKRQSPIMMTATTLVVVVILSLCVCGGLSSCSREYSREGFRSKVIRVEGGWGYDIFLDKKVVIHQPFIPAISGAKPFPSKKSARKAAQVVIDQFIDTGSPSLTKEMVEEILKDE